MIKRLIILIITLFIIIGAWLYLVISEYQALKKAQNHQTVSIQKLVENPIALPALNKNIDTL
ncbi:hypothetical protein [Fangia hongkongensis]|uniref:hypothetical protein n=1 Tax=Fangia hongkongensis TaxID=270495 RepID=UPI00035E0BFC|nr:hypothetical protein [Fangia hongkongensis]MBK2123777.1 hypothetical protein [Fangia hongkongensis]